MRLAAAKLLLLAALLPLAAQAKTSDRDQPMNVNADHTTANVTQDGDAVLTGNVIITQGTMRVTADRAVIKRKDGDIDEIVLTGGPSTLSQVNDNGETMDARAQQIVYTLSNNLMVLTGNVVVAQPRGNLTGETIKYNLDSGQLDGGGDGKRVSMQIMPKKKAAK
jgi:lipopolysaccharide export system protein LptA